MVKLDVGDRRQAMAMVIAPYEDRADEVLAVIEDAGNDLADPSMRDIWHRELDYGRTMNPHEGIEWALRCLADAAP